MSSLPLHPPPVKAEVQVFHRGRTIQRSRAIVSDSPGDSPSATRGLKSSRLSALDRQSRARFLRSARASRKEAARTRLITAAPRRGVGLLGLASVDSSRLLALEIPHGSRGVARAYVPRSPFRSRVAREREVVLSLGSQAREGLRLSIRRSIRPLRMIRKR